MVQASSKLLDKVIGPLLEMYNSGDLALVPHLSYQNLERFQSMCIAFHDHHSGLKTTFHMIGYMSKEVCLRENMREARSSQAIPGPASVAKTLEGNARKCY